MYGNCYGTPLTELRAAHSRALDVVLKVDVRGAAQVKRAIPQAVLMVLEPGAYAELASRLVGRRNERRQQRELRLKAVR